jgi:hypothetical protein
MTLANMRQNGVRVVIATCQCGHKADVNVDSLMSESIVVPEIGRRLGCSGCGGKLIETRPAWHTRPR